jgi:hypothetical protein
MAKPKPGRGTKEPPKGPTAAKTAEERRELDAACERALGEGRR